MRQRFMYLYFGQYLLRYAEKNKLSKAELSVYAECSASYIHRAMKGELDNPQLDIVLRLCDLMNVSVSEFIMDTAK